MKELAISIRNYTKDNYKEIINSIIKQGLKRRYKYKTVFGFRRVL